MTTPHPDYEHAEAFLKAFYAGEVEPREGDFIGSQIAPRVCGFHTGKVTTAGRRGNLIKSYEVQLASGRMTFIMANDLVMIAPAEFE